MPRVDAIWNHPLFQREYTAICNHEQTREFCCHDLAHLLDVARVAWIRCLEEDLPLSRELVYAAALLHDIGRARQYEEGIPHDIAGEQIAAEILGTVEPVNRFSSADCERILAAVGHHRRLDDDMPSLARVIAWADKASRPCYACSARAACNWPDEKKNLACEV